MKTNTGRRTRLRIGILADLKTRNRYRFRCTEHLIREVQAMTLRTKSNRQTNVTFPCTEQLVAGHAKVLTPRLRRNAHSPGDFLADVILVPVSGDVNMNLGTSAAVSFGVASNVNATAATFAGGATILTEPALGVAKMATALDDEDEDEDKDDSYDDDELDEDDDEDLDDEDDEEFDDDLDAEDGDLDDDDLDDEDEDDEDEE
jgi:hypothetical protein